MVMKNDAELVLKVLVLNLHRFLLCGFIYFSLTKRTHFMHVLFVLSNKL